MLTCTLVFRQLSYLCKCIYMAFLTPFLIYCLKYSTNSRIICFRNVKVKRRPEPFCFRIFFVIDTLQHSLLNIHSHLCSAQYSFSSLYRRRTYNTRRVASKCSISLWILNSILESSKGFLCFLLILEEFSNTITVRLRILGKFSYPNEFTFFFVTSESEKVLIRILWW